MTAVYFIASYDIADPDRYEQDYVPGAAATLTAAGGEVIVATGSATQLEGDAAGHTVVLRFPTDAAFRSWYESDEYADLRRLRFETTTNGSAVIATGFQ